MSETPDLTDESEPISSVLRPAETAAPKCLPESLDLHDECTQRFDRTRDVEVYLSLVRLPAEALIFPEPGTLNVARNPRNFSKEFARHAGKLGFSGFTFHHIRGTHGTLLLDRNVPVHVVAERLGDDAGVLHYAKRKRQQKANTDFSDQISALAAGFLGK